MHAFVETILSGCPEPVAEWIRRVPLSSRTPELTLIGLVFYVLMFYRKKRLNPRAKILRH